MRTWKPLAASTALILVLAACAEAPASAEPPASTKALGDTVEVQTQAPTPIEAGSECGAVDKSRFKPMPGDIGLGGPSLTHDDNPPEFRPMPGDIGLGGPVPPRTGTIRSDLRQSRKIRPV